MAGPEPDRLTLAAGVAERLVALGRAARPLEACAIVSGPSGDLGVRVHPARNALASPYRFDLHPADLVRILDDIEASDERMVAIFHSHPASPAVPSATDLREARYPVVHLIADAGGWLRGWRIGSGGEAREVAIGLSSVPG